jgi:hypothetical protein
VGFSSVEYAVLNCRATVNYEIEKMWKIAVVTSGTCLQEPRKLQKISIRIFNFNAMIPTQDIMNMRHEN